MICENIGSFFDFFVKIHIKSRAGGSFCSIHSFHLSLFTFHFSLSQKCEPQSGSTRGFALVKMGFLSCISLN